MRPNKLNPEIFVRDELGNLIEKELKLKNGDKVFLIPLCIGEISRLSLMDEETLIRHIMTKHVKNPKFSDEEIKRLKPEYVSMFITKVYEISDIDINKKNKDKDEDDFGRRLRETTAHRKIEDSNFFLLGLGYNIFTIPRLTFVEINELVAAHNRDVEKKKNEGKK